MLVETVRHESIRGTATRLFGDREIPRPARAADINVVPQRQKDARRACGFTLPSMRYRWMPVKEQGSCESQLRHAARHGDASLSARQIKER